MKTIKRTDGLDFGKQLLRGLDFCACGRAHKCPTDHVVIQEGAFELLPSLTEGYESILLVADTNTFSVAGNRVKEILAGKIKKSLVFKREGILVPDECALAELEAAITETEGCELVLGVGSGVINDLCKISSFNKGLPYYIFATAPSMDGYASRGSALILNGMKVTLNADVPKAIIADIDVLKDAPFEMIQSGYGDIIGKFSCLNDWKLAELTLGEYFCEYVYNEMLKIANETVFLAEDLKRRDKNAVGKLMQALVAAGIFMAYVGNSRPASGSEHHLSHFFEIVGILKNEEYFSHGTDVLYSAIETARVRELISKTDFSSCSKKHDAKKYEEEIRRVYGSLAEEIFALQKREKSYETERLDLYKAKEAEIKEVLRLAPSSEKMIEYTEAIGLSYEDFRSFYGEEKIADAIDYAKDLKDRYSVLWLRSELLGL